MAHNPSKQSRGDSDIDQLMRIGGQSSFLIQSALDGNSQLFIKHPDSAQAFRRELNALNDLKDSNRIVRLESVDNNKRSLTLAAAPGRRLDELVQFEGALSREESRKIIHQLVEALDFMHSYQGIGYVHYDLSPANIFWDRKTEQLTIIDFGTAYKLSEIPKEYRDTVIGTPLYLSPEKINRSPEHGTASDMFALGAIWYELLSGSPPFEPAVGRLEDQILRHEPLPLRRTDPETSAMVMKLLSKNAGDRPTASDVLRWIGETASAS